MGVAIRTPMRTAILMKKRDWGEHWRRLANTIKQHLLLLGRLMFCTTEESTPSKRRRRFARSVRNAMPVVGSYRQPLNNDDKGPKRYVVDYFVIVDYSIYKWCAITTTTVRSFGRETSLDRNCNLYLHNCES